MRPALVAAAACVAAAISAAAVSAVAAADADAAGRRLAAEIEASFASSDFASGRFGVEVIDLARGAPLYEHGAGEPLSLASNTKLVTTAAALDALGPGYRFETTLLRHGTVRVETIEGDLVVRGGGDPCMGARFDGEADAGPRRLARSLAAMGIHRVSGDVIADDRFLDREWQHPDWPKDQLDRWYEAPVSALSLNDGCVDVTVAPGAQKGAPAVVTVAPRCALVEVEDACKTTGTRSEHLVDIGRKAGGNHFVVRGAILAGSKPEAASIAETDPALLFATVLRERLIEEGVEVGGRARVVADGESLEGAVPLATHCSLLAQALPVVNKRSQNHVAEQIAKVLGAAKGGEGSWKAGAAVEAAFLERAGVEAGSFALLDGSGLARGNKMAARSLARLLAFMARHEHASVYLSSLAVALVDGTLEKRFKEHPQLKGRVLAKTGTINGVSSLSGYVLPKDGGVDAAAKGAAFAILVNGNKGGAARAHKAQDDVVAAIAEWVDR